MIFYSVITRFDCKSTSSAGSTDFSFFFLMLVQPIPNANRNPQNRYRKLHKTGCNGFLQRMVAIPEAHKEILAFVNYPGFDDFINTKLVVSKSPLTTQYTQKQPRVSPYS